METKFIAWGQYVLRSNLFQPPGNTLRLIDAAYGYGYDGVELDVQLSKDNVLVLMHDNTLDRTTHSSGLVNQFTAAELSKVRLKDPWNGPTCCVETLEAALRRNGTRGLFMVDMHHTVPKTVAAVKRSVEASNFDPALLLLLTHTREGGLLYKETFPKATVFLKAPHNLFPPQLTADFASMAVGLDGVLVPVANFPQARLAFRAETQKLGLKLAVYMHDSDLETLVDILEASVDYVTSYVPQVFGEARRRHALQ
jgi:glycerophosphoryl diester phosphodiesterase